VNIYMYLYVNVMFVCLYTYTNERQSRYGILFLPYDTRYYWWESIMQARKAVVVCIFVFVSTAPYLKRLLLMAFFGVLLMAGLLVRPFNLARDTRVESWCLLFLIAISMLLSSAWFLEEATDTEIALMTALFVVVPAVIILLLSSQATIARVYYKAEDKVLGRPEPGSKRARRRAPPSATSERSWYTGDYRSTRTSSSDSELDDIDPNSPSQPRRLGACACVCVYVCVCCVLFVCMHICIYACMCVCVYVCV